jgi:hypothetical protein
MEVESVQSTLMVIDNVKSSRMENDKYEYKLVCIPSHAQEWLVKLKIKSSYIDIKEIKVENVDINYSKILNDNYIIPVNNYIGNKYYLCGKIEHLC